MQDQKASQLGIGNDKQMIKNEQRSKLCRCILQDIFKNKTYRLNDLQ